MRPIWLRARVTGRANAVDAAPGPGDGTSHRGTAPGPTKRDEPLRRDASGLTQRHALSDASRYGSGPGERDEPVQLIRLRARVTGRANAVEAAPGPGDGTSPTERDEPLRRGASGLMQRHAPSGARAADARIARHTRNARMNATRTLAAEAASPAIASTRLVLPQPIQSTSGYGRPVSRADFKFRPFTGPGTDTGRVPMGY